jgi:hypothetical protein
MAIQEKDEQECTTVQVSLCGEVKKRVKEKQKELKEAGLPYSKPLAIQKLILGK